MTENLQSIIDEIEALRERRRSVIPDVKFKGLTEAQQAELKSIGNLIHAADERIAEAMSHAVIELGLTFRYAAADNNRLAVKAHVGPAFADEPPQIFRLREMPEWEDFVEALHRFVQIERQELPKDHPMHLKVPEHLSMGELHKWFKNHDWQRNVNRELPTLDK